MRAVNSEVGSGTQNGALWPDGAGMVYLGMAPWEGMWRNRQQLMSRFSKQLPVLYVEPWKRLRYVRRNRGIGALIANERENKYLSCLQPNLYVFSSPDSLPVSGSRWLSGVTTRRWLAALRNILPEVGIDKPILWLTFPDMWQVPGCLNEILSVYHIVDDYGGYTGTGQEKRDRLMRFENHIMQNVDVTIAVSPELIAARSAAGQDLHLVENAVDFDAFSSLVDRKEAPEDLKLLSGPILGYSGLIGKRLDLPLISRIATRQPDWSIVLVGDVDEQGCQQELDELRAQKNVHFLGNKPVQAVPGYVSRFDVGLLPYRVNLETSNISPLKLFEFLAAGIPVVGTPIPSVMRLGDLIRVGSDIDDFLTQCREALSNDSEQSRCRRQSFARENTWGRRVDQIAAILQSKLEDR